MEVKIPILNNEYAVIVCNGNLKELSKTLKRYHYPDYSDKFVKEATDQRRGATFYGHRCYPIIWIDKYSPATDAVGTLAHEAVHAVVSIFELIDERSYDEVFAHSVGAIVREVLDEWKIFRTTAKQ